MADLYRKSSLEQISSPEQLDKVLKVTSPMSWLALIGITLIVAVTVVWSIFGTMPVTITAPGIVSSPVGSNSVFIKESGAIVSVRVRSGSEIHLGDVVATYRDSSNQVRTVYSDQVGTVTAIMAEMDAQVDPGSDLIHVTPSAQSPQIVVCYVPLASAKKLDRGMEVKVTLDSLDSTAYGNMVARIINIDAYATSSRGMTSVLGSDNNLDSTFTKNGPVVAVACELATDSTSENGYYWSNSKGGKVIVSNGSLVTAKIITEEVAPITKLFSKLKDIWGD